jgi:hypothetical protein
MEAVMAHTPVNTKTGIDGALALIEEVKVMFTKMMAAEEVKRAALLVLLSPSPILDALHSPSPTFPPHTRPSSRGGALLVWDE